MCVARNDGSDDVMMMVSASQCVSNLCPSSSDIKPENLLISSEDVLKLCDFGEFLYRMLSTVPAGDQTVIVVMQKRTYSIETIFSLHQSFRSADRLYKAI